MFHLYCNKHIILTSGQSIKLFLNSYLFTDMLLQLIDLTGEVSLCSGWQLMQTLKTGQNSEDNYLYSAHSQMGLHHIPFPRALEKQWERCQKDCKSQRLRKMRTIQMLLSLTGPLQIWCLQKTCTIASYSVFQHERKGLSSLHHKIRQKLIKMLLY